MERLLLLFQRYLSNVISEHEFSEMIHLLSQQDPTLLSPALQDLWQQHNLYSLPADRWDEQMRTLKNASAKVIQLNRRRKIFTAAAVVIAVIASITFFITTSPPIPGKQPVVDVAHDVLAPDKTQATITLSDGRVVYLNNVSPGELVLQEGIKLVKTADGKITYSSTAGAATVQETAVNTLHNPRGSQAIDVQLSDGSRVWLNAGSTITYPLAFTASERKVQMTGEAYFEIAPDKTKPFYVSKGDVQVLVLGTHFNVNAYDDENDIKVTLLEGAVQVNSGHNTATLKPGEQASVIPGSDPESIRVNKGADVEQVMAWKNGFFAFRDADIKTVMRQIGRWYNINVVFEGTVTSDKFSGEIDRGIPLKKLLDNLSGTRIHFKIEGNKLTVMN